MKRTITLSVAAIALASVGLAGCSEKGKDGENGESADAGDMPEPGKYDMTMQVTKFDVTGDSQEAKMAEAMMKGKDGKGMTTTQSTCITKESQKKKGWRDAANSMVESMKKDGQNCEQVRDNSTNSKLDVAVKCDGMNMDMTGTSSNDGFEVNVAMNGANPQMQGMEVDMEMKLSGKRTGDCTAEEIKDANEQLKAAQDAKAAS